MKLLLAILLAGAGQDRATSDWSLVVAMGPAEDRREADKQVNRALLDQAYPLVANGKISHEVCQGDGNGLVGPNLSKDYLNQVARRLKLNKVDRAALERDCEIWSAGFEKGLTSAGNLTPSNPN